MPPPDPMVDAGSLLALTSELREANEVVEASKASAEQRSRWQRHLVGIAEGGTEDIERARNQLRRFMATLDRTA